MSCLSNFSDINETFIVEPVGAIPSLTACTGVYTDAIISCSGNTQIFMGTGIITFDGNIYTNDNITASTINASAFYSGGTNIIDIINNAVVLITGGTFNDVTDTLSLYNGKGGIINVTGFTDYYTTGATLIGKTVYFDRNDMLSAYTLNLNSFSSADIYSTGVTFQDNQIIIARNDGVNLNTFINTFTGLTINGTLNVTDILANSLSANTVSATTFYGDGSNLTGISTQDTKVTAFTYNNNTFTISDSTGGTFNALFDTVTGLTVNGVLSATTLSGGTIFGNGSGLTNVILSVSGGTGISATTVDGKVTLINTATNQAISITGGTNIEVVSNYPSFGINYTGQTVFDYLSLSGGTVSGNTTFVSGLTANTISASEYKNLPIDPDTYVTGFTFDPNTYILDLKQNTNTSFSAFSANLAILASDVTITGGSYNPTTGVATFRSNTTGSSASFEVSGFTSGLTDTVITSFGYTPSSNTFTINDSRFSAFTAAFTAVSGLSINGDLTVTGNTSLQALTATTISASSYTNLPKDVYVTGGTYSAGTIYFINNTGGTFDVSGLSTSTATQFTGGTVTGATSFTGGLSANSLTVTTGNTSLQALTATTISASSYTNLPNTLYTGDGTLLGNRLVNLSSYTLNFSSTTYNNTLVLSGGNVGIGTLASQYKLDVSGNTRIQSGLVVGVSTSTTNTIELNPTVTGTSPYMHFFYKNAVDRRISFISDSTSLNVINGFLFSSDGTLANAQQVIVSDVLAKNNIDVQGGILKVIGTGDNYIRMYQRGVADRGVIGFSAGSGNLQIRVNGATNLSSGTLSTTFFSDGNVGIGVSSNSASYKLQVSGNTIIYSGLNANAISATTISATTYFNLPVTADTFVTGFTLSSNTLTLRQNRQDQYSAFTISLSAYTGSSAINIYNSNGTLTSNRIVNVDGYTLNFSSTTYNNTLVLSGGNVGIGTASPTAKLHVGNATSFLKVTNNWLGGNGTWVDLSLDGPSGIGSGGPGVNPFFAYASFDGAWFSDAVIGDVAYRNVSGKLLFGNTSTTAGMALSSDNLGIGTVSPTNRLHITASTNPVRINGISQNITDQEYLTIDTQGVVHKITVPTKKIILRRIEMGSKFFDDNLNLINFFENTFKQKIGDILESSSYSSCNVDYYYTINIGANKRDKTLYTVGDIYNYVSDITNLVNFIVDTYGGIQVNLYAEVYFPIDSNQGAPTQIKLVNPLFNSLNPSKNSKHNSDIGYVGYVRNTQIAGGIVTPKLKSSNTLLSDFYLGWNNYYDITSNDIPKQIMNIVASSGFYGPLSGYSQLAFSYDYGNWTTQIREVIKNSVYIESNTKFYSKFKIPVNQHGFFEVCKNHWNNFYGDLVYDYVGGSDPTTFGLATTDSTYSESFLQLIDTYRLYPNGEPSVIYYNGNDENTHLNDLSYNVGVPKQLKYITKPSGGYNGPSRNRSFIQVLPGYNDVYILKIEVNGVPSLDGTEHVFLQAINDSLVINDSSLKNNEYWNQLSTNNSSILSWLGDSTNFNSKGYGDYILLQSNETKIQELIAYNNANNGWQGPNGSIVINAIYKGWSFRPMIYPLNLNQILLEVNESFFVDGSGNVVESLNSTNNHADVSGYGLTNKELRLIVNHKKLNKMQCITTGLSFTYQKSANDNAIFQLTTNENIEKLVLDNIKGNWAKNIKPGNIEIYFAFYDSSIGTTSVIPNYKIIVANYGDNEIFKLIRGEVGY